MNKQLLKVIACVACGSLAALAQANDGQAQPTEVQTESENAAATAAQGEQAATEEAASEDDAIVQKVLISAATSGRGTKICRTERPIGSHIPKQVCRTKYEMDADREESMQSIRETDMRRRNARSTRAGTGLDMKTYKRGGY